MKRQYKILITVFSVFTILLGCCFSVAAETTKEYTWITSKDQMVTFRIINTSDGSYLPVEKFTPTEGNNDIGVGYTFGKPHTNFEADGILVEILPNSDFIYTLNPSYHYTFVFRVIRNKDWEEVDEVVMALKDSFGEYAFSSGFALTGSTDYYDYYSMTFFPDDIARIQNITSVQFQIKFKNYLEGWMKFYFSKYCIVTVSNPTADEINAAIKESTDKITGEIQDSTDKITGEIQDSTDTIVNGWAPDPERPSGSETVDDYHSAESELLSSATNGIEQANSMFSGLGANLERYSGSLLAVSAFVDNLIGDVPVLSVLLWVSLTIGLFGLIFNLGQTLVSRFGNGKSGKRGG